MKNEQDRSLNPPRLREQQGDRDADVAHAARLVAAARLRDTSDDQADRVWRKLGADGSVTQAASWSSRRRAPAPWMRPVMAGFAVVGMVSLAYAGATMGRRLYAEWRASQAAVTPEQGQGNGRATTDRAIVRRQPAPTTTVPLVSAPSPTTDAVPSTAPAAAPTTMVKPRIHALPDPAVAVNTALDRESESVKGAVRALRRDADYERARLYLRYYMTQFPDGVFHEEALALSVEAAEKAGDLVEAGTLASRYLARYPEGRYRANVSRTQRRAGAGVRK